ncbi:Nn.00g044220.m01.CDS01 [Neocucurbitaria sp. VM-36]
MPRTRSFTHPADLYLIIDLPSNSSLSSRPLFHPSKIDDYDKRGSLDLNALSDGTAHAAILAINDDFRHVIDMKAVLDENSILVPQAELFNAAKRYNIFDICIDDNGVASLNIRGAIDV